MPSFANEEDRSIALSMERWQQTAKDEVDDIGGWRECPREKLYSSDPFPYSPFNNGEPTGFFGETALITAWIARKFPKLDPEPIQRVYAAINAWFTDHNSDRIPPQNQLESDLGQAIILLTAVWEEIRSRSVQETSTDPNSPLVATTDATPFVGTVIQVAIHKALDGRAMKKTALASEVCNGDWSRLYKPGGITEMQDNGIVVNKRGVGYYRPDAPPPNMIIARRQN